MGQFYVAQVVFERDMIILDKKQFSCFSSLDIINFNKAMLEKSLNDKYTKKVLTNLKNKLTLGELYYWSILYIHQDMIKLLNFDEKYYYMTHNAYTIIKVKYGKWVRNNIEIVAVEGNHVFLKNKEK